MSVMSLRYIFNALRRYGIKGVFTFFAGRLHDRTFMRKLKKTLKEHPPKAGFTLIAEFHSPIGLNKVMRDLAIMMKDAGIPYQTIDKPCLNPIPKSATESFMTPESEFVLNKYTHIITMREPLTVSDRRCKVYCAEFWEFEDGFTECCTEVLLAKNVLSFSNFNHDVFRKLLPAEINVKKILYPFQFKHKTLSPVDETRRKFAIGKKSFAIFFNFDYASGYYRKNPEGIIKAVAIAFPSNEDVQIVFKTMRAKSNRETNAKLHFLAEKLGVADKLITVDDFISQEDLVNLTNACDVYMSLHRGEGFGLGVAEAMSLGKPVIVTDYSSTTEFCTTENSFPVPFKLTVPEPEYTTSSLYDKVSLWAEPDIDAAAAVLRKLYDNPSLRAKTGEAAAKFMNEYFSTANFRKSIESLLG